METVSIAIITVLTAAASRRPPRTDLGSNRIPIGFLFIVDSDGARKFGVSGVREPQDSLKTRRVTQPPRRTLDASTRASRRRFDGARAIVIAEGDEWWR
jgi:hypothetical protein